MENQWIRRAKAIRDGTLTLKQILFLSIPHLEALYGGAAGGGKSEALLIGALQYVNYPGYNSLILRRAYSDLNLPEALMDRSHQWLEGTGAHWNGQDHSWTFPSGSRLVFGYLKADRDKYRYQSAAFQYIGFDELTEFLESQYQYLASRLRRLKNFNIPLRLRGASNPGGVGHDWVKRRFITEGPIHERMYIPALFRENPGLDHATYLQSLMLLDAITRRQLKDGDWSARHGGSKFKREWFEIVPSMPQGTYKTVRYWDLASTTATEGRDPDYTVGLKMSTYKGIFHIQDVNRFRGSPQTVESKIKKTAEADDHLVTIYIEQEPGSAGKSLISYYSREVLSGYTFHGHRTTGSKEIRANPLSSAVEHRNVKLVDGTWIGDYLDEMEAFPLGSHDDQVDASSGAFEVLSRKRGFFI